MRIHDEETKKEKNERLGLVDNVQREDLIRQLPIVLIIFAASILLCTFIINNNTHKPIGNPYECVNCKDLGRACKEHKEFNSINYLKDRIYKSIINIDKLNNEDYNKGIEKHKYYVYGENSYNLDCDFCKSKQSECDGCIYTRISIIEYINQTIESEYEYMCTDCKSLGKPNCNSCIEHTVDKTLEKIITK